MIDISQSPGTKILPALSIVINASGEKLIDMAGFSSFIVYKIDVKDDFTLYNGNSKGGSG